ALLSALRFSQPGPSHAPHGASQRSDQTHHGTAHAGGRRLLSWKGLGTTRGRAAGPADASLLVGGGVLPRGRGRMVNLAHVPNHFQMEPTFCFWPAGNASDRGGDRRWIEVH